MGYPHMSVNDAAFHSPVAIVICSEIGGFSDEHYFVFTGSVLHSQQERFRKSWHPVSLFVSLG